MGRSGLIALPLLAACAGPMAPQAPPLPTPQTDTCAVRQYAEVIGQDATALERILILGPVRLIRPMTAISKDYRAERVNITIDSANRVTRLWCG